MGVLPAGVSIDGGCKACGKLTDYGNRGLGPRLRCAVELAPVPVAERGVSGVLPSCDDCSAPCGCGLSLATSGVLGAAGALSFAGGATSGVDDASDVIGSASDLMVVLVVLASA